TVGGAMPRLKPCARPTHGCAASLHALPGAWGRRETRMNKVWMLMATLAVPTAAGAVGLGQVPGTAYRFKQPGMQIDPVISDGRVLYRSFEDPSNGPLMYTDTVPLSTVTREHVYN